MDAKWKLADNPVMPVAGQARYPDSTAEMRIGLDVGEVPAYFDLLSFLPPAEYSALLSPVSATGTSDPLLFDWRRVRQPVRSGNDQRAALAACFEAAGMRNVQSDGMPTGTVTVLANGHG